MRILCASFDDQPVFPRPALPGAPPLLHEVSSKSRFSQMPELCARARLRIARDLRDLEQRAPAAVAHQCPDPPELPAEAVVIQGWVIDNAIESDPPFRVVPHVRRHRYIAISKNVIALFPSTSDSRTADGQPHRGAVARPLSPLLSTGHVRLVSATCPPQPDSTALTYCDSNAQPTTPPEAGAFVTHFPLPRRNSRSRLSTFRPSSSARAPAVIGPRRSNASIR
jgi:hypothetical protein